MPDRSSKTDRRWFFAILVTAVLVRLITWWVRPAFWGDESALAMNVAPLSFSEIGQPYRYWQICPILFLLLTKAFVVVLGASELTFRLLPLLSGLVVAPLVYVAAHAMAGRRAALYAMLLVAISPYLVYFSGEFKPYGTDAALSIGAIALAARILEDPDDRRLQILLVVFGAAAVWTSLPVVFVLGACGVVLGVGELSTRRRPFALALLLLAAVLWGGGIFLHLTEFISRGSIADSKNVTQFWSHGFMPFPPRSLADLRWGPGKFFFLFHQPGGFQAWLRYPVGLLFLFGLWILAKRSRPNFALLVLPGLLLLVASALHRYPVQSRLVLFLVPLLAIGLGIAFDAFADRARGPVLVAIALILVHPALETARYLRPQSGPDLRDFAQLLSTEPSPLDAIYVDDTTRYAYLYYEWAYPPPIPPIDTSSVGLSGNVAVGKPHPYLKQLHPLFGKPRVFVLISNYGVPYEPAIWTNYITDYFDRAGGKRLVEIRGESHWYLVYELSSADDPYRYSSMTF